MVLFYLKKNMSSVKKFSLFVLTAFLLCGCSSIGSTLHRINNFRTPEQEYKFTPAVDENVHFVIIPFNNNLSQIQFAAKVESILIDTGFNIQDRPRGLKVIESTTGTGIAQQKEVNSVRIERYTTGGEIQADYIVKTIYKAASYSSPSLGTVKFKRKKDKRILCVANISGSKEKVTKEILQQLEKIRLVTKVAL